MSQSEQVSGNEKRKIRSTTRLYIIQALFQMEQLGLSTDEVVEEFVVHRFAAKNMKRANCLMVMKPFLNLFRGCSKLSGIYRSAYR